MNTNIRVRNDRLRAEMNMNPPLQKAIAVYHIIQVVAIIICALVAINYRLFYYLLLAILPVIFFIIFWVASKCTFQDKVVILVHFNPILSTLWFITVFPVFVLVCLMSQDFDMYAYYYADTLVLRGIVVTAITGISSLNSATFAVVGIWKSARNVVLSARSSERNPVDAVGCVSPPYDAPVTFTDLNGI